MTRVLSTLAALLLIGFAAFGGAPSANSQAGSGWIQLFNGKNLDGWTPSNDDVNWRVEDGLIVADKNTGKGLNYLVSKEPYKDHEIYAEMWASPDANSGIFFRCNPKQIDIKTCYEVNIFDTRPDQTYGTGSITLFAEVNPMPKAGNQWNTIEISAKGRNIIVKFNGKQTVDLQNGLFAQGHLALQYGAGTIKWRKFAVRPL